MYSRGVLRKFLSPTFCIVFATACSHQLPLESLPKEVRPNRSLAQTRDQIYGENQALENGRNKKNKEYIFRNVASAFPDNGKRMMVKDSVKNKDSVISIAQASPWKQRVLYDSNFIEENNKRFRNPNKAFFAIPLDEPQARRLALKINPKINEESDYQMEASGQDDSFEPNNSMELAFDLGASEGKWLSLTTADKRGEGVQWDEDWFKVIVSPHFRQLFVDLRYQHYLGNIGLSLFNDKGELVSKSDRDGDDEFINVLLEKGGIYYIKIDGNQKGNHYDFRYWSQFTGGKDDLAEENDTLKTAFDLTSYQGKWLSETLGEGVAADDDYYKIKVPTDKKRVIIDMRYKVAFGDIDLKLLDSTGKTIASSSNISDDEYIDFTLPSGGIYYVRVYPFNLQKNANMYDLKWKAERPSRKDPSQLLTKSASLNMTNQR